MKNRVPSEDWRLAITKILWYTREITRLRRHGIGPPNKVDYQYIRNSLVVRRLGSLNSFMDKY